MAKNITTPQIIEHDCQILLRIKDTLQGNADVLNWHEDLPASEWIGVSVANHRVVQLDLRAKQLTGKIPSELGKLDKLKYLDLSNNFLKGAIPAELGDLANLQVRKQRIPARGLKLTIQFSQIVDIVIGCVRQQRIPDRRLKLTVFRSMFLILFNRQTTTNPR